MKRVHSHIVALLALTHCVAFAAASDVLYRRDGEQEPGRLVSMSRDSLQFEGTNGITTLKKADVVRIQLQRSREYDDILDVGQITDDALKTCLASQPSADVYPAAGYATLLYRRVVDLTEPGVVKDTVRKIIKVLQQRGESAASEFAGYFEDTDQVNIDYALTITPDGHVLHLSDEAIKNESLFAMLPDYRRFSRMRFAAKEPRPGSILDIQYTVVRRRTDPLESFYSEELFQESEPLLRKDVVIRLRKEDAGKLHVRLSGPDVIVPLTQDVSGELILAWSLREAQAGILPEPMMPPHETFAPLLTVSFGGTWDEVIAECVKAYCPPAPSPDPLTEQAVALDAKDGPRGMYNQVTRGIRTAPVPQLACRLRPQDAGTVLGRGVANEFDKNYLLYRLLQAANIPCAFALVRSRDQGPLAEDVPAARAFNRSAVYIAALEQYVTTGSDVLSFGTLPGIMQGAPALLITPKGGQLTTTPQPDAESETSSTRFAGKLSEDGALMLDITYSGTGNAATWIRGFKDADEAQVRNTMEQIAGHLHPGAQLLDYSTTDLADLNVDPAITLKCQIPGYAIAAGRDLLLFDIPALDFDAADAGRPTREHDLFWENAFCEKVEGHIETPRAFNVYALPDKVDLSDATSACAANIQAAPGSVDVSIMFTVKTPQAPVSAYADYKHSKEQLAELPRQRIILAR